MQLESGSGVEVGLEARRLGASAQEGVVAAVLHAMTDIFPALLSASSGSPVRSV